MDDLEISTNSVIELTASLEKIFQCFRKSGLKLSPEKSQIGLPEIEILGNMISSQGVTP